VRAVVFGDGHKAATGTCSSSTGDNNLCTVGGFAGAVESVVIDSNTFAARDKLPIAGGTDTTVVGLPSSNSSPLDTTIGSRGKQPILLVGGDVLGLLTEDEFSNLLGLSVVICKKAFEFGLV
jgi:hypothetical protein